MQKIPQKIVVLFAIVKISDIFSAYFFVNFCLKIWKNYTRWKKIAKFYGNIYYCKFFWEILPIFRWKILHCAKKITFFYAKYCRKISNAKITAKVCEKIYEKINGKHFNLIPRATGHQNGSKLPKIACFETNPKKVNGIPFCMWRSSCCKKTFNRFPEAQ